MTNHPHISKIRTYSIDVTESETPWKLWQIKRDSHWYTCTETDMYFGKKRQYRRVAQRGECSLCLEDLLHEAPCVIK